MPSGCWLLVLYEVETSPAKAVAADRLGQLLRHDVDHATQRVGAIKHAGRSADHLDPLGVAGIHVGGVLVAPLLGFQPLPVGDHGPG